LETARAFPKHSSDGLGLAFVQVVSVTIVEVCLADEEAYAVECDLLGLQDSFREPDEPIGRLERFLMLLELIVVCLALLLDGEGERDEGRLTDVLRQRLFSEGAAQAAIAVFEGMDTLEIEVA